MLPAILVNDKVVTGSHHGDAYQKLTVEEKTQPLLIGFANDQKFIADNQIIYLKEIILIRHAESTSQHITPNGICQASKIAQFINLHFADFNLFTSPYERCVQTVDVISRECNLTYTVNDQLGKQTENEDFEKRIIEVVDQLPKKSIIITHTDFIKTLLKITKLDNVDFIPNCSVTYIFYNKLIWSIKDVINN